MDFQKIGGIRVSSNLWMTTRGGWNKMRAHAVDDIAPAPPSAARTARRARAPALAPAPPQEPMHCQSTVVLVVDMVESVRLMQTCEAATVRRWSRTIHRVRDKLLRRHRGQLVKSLGDGLMARFGEVRDAVAAAQAIHALLDEENRGLTAGQRMQVRAGVHVAQAWSDGTDLYGAGVNLAARLATLGRPGETIGSAAVRDGLIPGLDAACEDLGECYFKHLSQPVRAFRISAPGSTSTAHASAERQREFLAMQPVIAVIPFSSRGGDTQSVAIGELIADGVNGLLSGSQHLGVVSRLSTTAFRDRATGITEIEKHLGATYVLSGSYASVGSRLLVNAELARAADGHVVWAGRLGADVQDLLQVRSELIDAIAQAVNQQVFAIEMKRTLAQPLPTLDSYALLLGAIHRMHCANRGEFDRTGQLLEYLIERHPCVAAPRTWLAHWYILRATRGLSRDRARDARIALDLTRRALDVDPSDSLAMAVKGFVHCHLLKDLDTARQRCDDALAVNPNQALAWLYKSAIHAFRGEGEAATGAAARALALSPLDPQRYYFDSLAATAAVAAQDYVRAQRLAESSLRLNRMHSSTWRMLTVTLVEQGKLGDAEAAMHQLRRLEPGLTVASYLARMPNGESATGKQWAAALATAGLPSA